MDPLPTAVFLKRMNSLFASAFNPTLSLFDFRVLNFVCLELDSGYGKKFGFYSYSYWGSTRLRSQHFDICLENKSRVGTPIHRYLVATFQITHFFWFRFWPTHEKGWPPLALPDYKEFVVECYNANVPFHLQSGQQSGQAIATWTSARALSAPTWG